MTPHDFFGRSRTVVQVSAVLVNADEPVKVIFSAGVAAPPELVRVNVWDALWPTVIVL